MPLVYSEKLSQRKKLSLPEKMVSSEADLKRESRNKYRDMYMFGGNRVRVLIRDKYKCVKCGMTNKQHLRKWESEITVDHKDGLGKNSKIKNNHMGNLQTLCCVCHGKKDRQRQTDAHSLRKFVYTIFWYQGKWVAKSSESKNIRGYASQPRESLRDLLVNLTRARKNK